MKLKRIAEVENDNFFCPQSSACGVLPLTSIKADNERNNT